MNINKDYNGQELTISVEGRIDTITSQDLDNEIKNEMGKFDSLIMDFTNMEYISSAGLRVLIATQKKLKPQGIAFSIINTSDSIKEILSVSGLDNILNIQ